MKLKKSFSVFVPFLLLFAAMLTACGNHQPLNDRWKNAIYKEDSVVGSGSLSYALEVKAGETSVTITVKTDETNLGRSLLNLGIISGEESEYGFYIKAVNGMVADYDTDQTYWALYENGKMAMTGVDGITVTDGAHYELVCSNG